MSKDDPEANCMPTGVLRQVLFPFPGGFCRPPTSSPFIRRQHSQLPSDYMNRKEHPKNVNPSWYGDSIGHFEGDTLW